MSLAASQLGAIALGLLSWPLLEYGLHRFVLHGLKPFSTWHNTHHRHADLPSSGRAVSMVLIVSAAFISNWTEGDIGASECLCMGMLCGYGGYAFTHHAIHHCRCDTAWLRRRKFCHALHHDPALPPGYYGITSGLWDSVLGSRHRFEF